MSKVIKARPDFGTVFEFQNDVTGASFNVYLATLLQCLCIAEELHVVPPFEMNWESSVIVPELKEKYVF